MFNKRTQLTRIPNEVSSDSPETTPLNQSLPRDYRTELSTRDLNSSSSSNMDTIDANTKNILIKVAYDVVLLCCVGFPILIFFIFGKPYERGFFCDDESLMHPFHESTVTHEVLYSVGFGLPIITIIITEFIRWKLGADNARELKFFGYEIPFWVQNLYKYFGIFLFGAACSQLTTDIGKYTIGRLRPHFISVCQPIMPGNTTCSDLINQYKYIEVFDCGNKDSTKRRLKEMRLSFPSGHSSFSMYTMVFAALYLHCRMNWRGSKLLKHFLQFAFIMAAWYTALSRISDYKHHWSDVLSGSLQGLIVCLIIIYGVSDLFKNRWAKPDLPTTRYELNSQRSQSVNGNNQ